MDSWLGADEVMGLLGIRRQTLYAYASRGFLRRTTAPGSKRSFYAREDVEKLLARKQIRDVQNNGIPGQLPMAVPGTIASAITELTPEGPKYRGYAVDALAVHPGRIENIAELLWTGVLTDDPLVWEYEPIADNLEAAVAALGSGSGDHAVPFLRILCNVSLVLGASAAMEMRSGSTQRLARRLVATYAGCLAYLKKGGVFIRPRNEESIAETAARALGVDARADSIRVLDSVFIWCADHELSSATYTARLIASTGAGLHGCLIGAIAAHSGSALGGGCDRTEEFISNRLSTIQLKDMASRIARTGRQFPGFGHAIYPGGDPRALGLLKVASEIAPAKALSDIERMIDIVRTEAGMGPTLELGLIAIARALMLPPRAASALWAVGRSVGWVAHVMEQRLAGTQIRPRAKLGPQ
ncbi:citrate synthase [Pusillimonas sp.]|uniref:citrate synthase n=1 Tax=Pusillimonas sp. TaxID=3040095 RepID=UPI0029B35337|nr:citrate synthase [Pusillimonas sp.]MDX3895569.1 citrate synthase [Pusillimonas sp.]